MMLSTHAGLWLAQGVATLPDTIVTKQVAAPTGLGTLATVLNGIVSVVLIVLLAALIPMALGARRAIQRVDALVDRLSRELGPVVTRVTAVSENVDYISKAARGEIQEITRTVRRATDGVSGGIDAVERRVAELGALVQLAQKELEDAVVSTAATLRGVRAGAGMLRSLVPEDRRARSDDWPIDDDEEFEDDEDEAPPRTRRARGEGPRIRSRPAKGERR